MNALAPRDGYRLWAPTYSAETVISRLEDDLVSSLTPPLQGLRLLDAGCGTGRRLVGTRAAAAVGIDICPEMIESGIGYPSGASSIRTMVGDIRCLPLPDRHFDVIWCRLAIGHVSNCAAVYAELARVARTGGQVIVSDFHPDAHAAGHRRTFRAGGEVHEVEHHVHNASAHVAAARAAGLELARIDESSIGPGVRHFYEAAGLDDRYRAHHGLKVVWALSFRRAA